jgi:uncharacterized membrane protein
MGRGIRTTQGATSCTVFVKQKNQRIAVDGAGLVNYLDSVEANRDRNQQKYFEVLHKIHQKKVPCVLDKDQEDAFKKALEKRASR